MFSIDFNEDVSVSVMLDQPMITKKQNKTSEAGLNSLKNRLAAGSRTVELLCGKKF